MPKKTFQFDAINKKFEVKCNMPGKDYSVACPVIKVYRAGIGTVLSTSAHDFDKTYVHLAEAASVETVKIMFDIGQSMCNCCSFNEVRGKTK